MPLVQCPECNKEISDAALHCVGCGHPMHAALVRSGSLEALRREQASAAGVICPDCGSDDTRSLPLVHAEGFSSVAGRSWAMGHQQTALSASVAPPDTRDFRPNFILGIVLWGGLLFLLAYLGASFAFVTPFAVVGGAGLIYSYPRIRWDRDAVEREQGEWERSFMCRRCGTIFEGA